MPVAGNIITNLTTNTSQFRSGLTQGRGLLGSFVSHGTKLLSGFAAAWLGFRGIAAVKDQLQELDKVAKLASTTGLSAATIIGGGFGAEQSGQSIETLNDALLQHQRRLGEAATKGGAVSRAYQSLGLDAQKLAKLAPDEALLQTVDALSGIQNAAVRASLEYQLFGRQGQKLDVLFQGGRKSLEAFRTEAEQMQLGFTVDELKRVEAANDAVNKIARTRDAFFGQIAVGIAPLIEEFATELQGFAVEFPKIAKEVKPLLSDLAALVRLTAEWRNEIATLKDIVTFDVPSVTELGRQFAAGDASASGLAGTLKDARSELTQFAGRAAAAAPDADTLAESLDHVTTMADRMAERLTTAQNTLRPFLDAAKTDGQRAGDAIRSINDAVAEMRNQGVSISDDRRLQLQQAALDQIYGYSDALRSVQDEIKQLNGLTDEDLFISRLEEAGFKDNLIQQLRDTYAARDQLRADQEAKDKASAERLGKFARAGEIRESLTSPLDRFKDDAKEIGELVSGGFLSGADAQAALAKLRREFEEETAAAGSQNKTRDSKAVVSAIDVRGVESQQMLANLFNRRRDDGAAKQATAQDKTTEAVREVRDVMDRIRDDLAKLTIPGPKAFGA